MIAVVLMALFTVSAVFFLIESGRCSRTAAAEIVLSRAWTSRFARQTLEESGTLLWKRIKNLRASVKRRQKRR